MSDQVISGQSRAPSACGSLTSGNIQHARSPLGFFQSLPDNSATRGRSAVDDVSRPPSPGNSVDEPISAGIRRQRTYSHTEDDGLTVLTPRCTKRLKVYANKLAADTGVPAKDLHAFIDVRCYLIAPSGLSDLDKILDRRHISHAY